MTTDSDLKVAETEETTEPEKYSVVITYFPFGGDAASLRLAAYIGGISYADIFTTSEEHEQCLQNGTRRWRGLPEITVNQENGEELLTIGHSNTCLRYIGRLTDLYPSNNPLLAILVDEILDSADDVKRAMRGNLGSKESRARMISEDGMLTYWLNRFELRLIENAKRGCTNGYFVGDVLTIADLKAFELFHGLYLVFAATEDISDGWIDCFPNIKQHYQSIFAMKKVKEFMGDLSMRIGQFKAGDKSQKIDYVSGKFVPATF